MSRISLDISELFNSEDSEGHLLAEFLQKRRGILPSENFILYQHRENRISLDVQVEDAPQSELLHDDNNAKNVEVNMSRLFGKGEPDLNMAEDLPCSIKELPPANLPTSNGEVLEEPASNNVIPNGSKSPLHLPNTKIIALRQSCSNMSPSDRLRRLSLRKYSNQRPGRRILLEELNKLDETEKISSDLDFNPGICSTPFVMSPKSSLPPLQNDPESASCQTLKSSDFREIMRIDENLNAILKESVNSESNKTNVIQVNGTFNLPEPTQPHVIKNVDIEKENVNVTKLELRPKVVDVREILAPQKRRTTISDANVDASVVQNSLGNNVKSSSNRNVEEKPQSPSPDDNALQQSKSSPLSNNDLLSSKDGNNEAEQDHEEKNKTLAPDSNAEVHNLPDRTILVKTVSNEKALHYLHGKPQPIQVVTPPLLSPVQSTNRLSKSPPLHNNDLIPCEEDRTDLVSTSLKMQRSSQGPLNLVNRRLTRGKRGRSSQQIPHVTASSSSESNTEMERVSPPPAHKHTPKLNGTRWRSKRKRKATLNKPPGVPLNGELYAKELARLTNNEILDLRKRNSMGEVFTSNVLTRNSIKVEELRKQKQQDLEERIKLELVKRRLSTENGRMSSHQQKQPIDVRGDSKLLVQDIVTESTELHNQQERVSFKISRQNNKQVSEVLQHYMEIPQKIMARKQTSNHTKRSLYTKNDFEITVVESHCTAQGVSVGITNNTEKCTQSPTRCDVDEEMPPLRIITPPPPFHAAEEIDRPITPLLAPPVQFVSSPRKHKLLEEAEPENELFKKPTGVPPKRGRRQKENNSNTTTDSSSNSTSTLRRSSRTTAPNKRLLFVQDLYQRCFEKTLKNYNSRNASRSITTSIASSTASSRTKQNALSTHSSPPPISPDNKRSKKQSNASRKLTTAETSKKMSQKSRQLSPAMESEETTASKKLTIAETSKKRLQKLTPSTESEDLTEPSTSVKQRPRRGRQKKEPQTTSSSTQVESKKINEAPIEKPKRQRLGRKKELQSVKQIEPVREASPGIEQDNDTPKKKKQNARIPRKKSKNEQISLLAPPMSPLESSSMQPGTSKESIHPDLDYSHVPLPYPPPVQHLNNVFDRLRTVGTLPIQPDYLPSTSQSHQSQRQSSLAAKNPRCRELRVNIKKLKYPLPGNGNYNTNINNKNNNNYSNSSCSQQQFPDSSLSSNVELISWLKTVKDTEYYGPNNEIFREMRISSHANLCFTKLQGVEYAFYDTDETASLGYLRFKPRQIKQKKKTKYFHLHFITIVGTFRVMANDREKILTPGDMVAIEKLVLYEIENITDDIGILMVIKK